MKKLNSETLRIFPSDLTWNHSARVNLLCRTGRGHAGVDEGVVPGVQQAGHDGEHW